MKTHYLQLILIFAAGMHANKAAYAFFTYREFFKGKGKMVITSDNPLYTLDYFITTNRNEALWAAVVCVILLLAVALYRAPK